MNFQLNVLQLNNNNNKKKKSQNIYLIQKISYFSLRMVIYYYFKIY